jgi:hypothetical protein
MNLYLALHLFLASNSIYIQTATLVLASVSNISPIWYGYQFNSMVSNAYIKQTLRVWSTEPTDAESFDAPSEPSRGVWFPSRDGPVFDNMSVIRLSASHVESQHRVVPSKPSDDLVPQRHRPQTKQEPITTRSYEQWCHTRPTDAAQDRSLIQTRHK